ncbi:MAG: hypothetical protein KKC01_02750 [Gammaproteobacteria bacterium]|nr:hypothetical protein [Gammaproteobacteria bacterium]
MQQRSKCNTALHRSLLLCLLIACSSPAQELFAPSVSIGTNSQNAVAAYQHVKQAADSAFSNGHHRKAYDTYLTLARLGDQFSQYRLAFMLHNGMGVPRDLTKELAWAYVAAEKRTQPALVYPAGNTVTFRARPEAAVSGAIRSEWQALDKDCNAVMQPQGRSRRASRKALICCVMALGHGVAMTCEPCLAAKRFPTR